MLAQQAATHYHKAHKRSEDENKSSTHDNVLMWHKKFISPYPLHVSLICRGRELHSQVIGLMTHYPALNRILA